MKHFLITRFNLISKIWEEDIDRPLAISDSWLENRFNIFEKFCLPSVINQNNKNFIWLVLFDQRTPQACRERIYGYNKMVYNYNPLFIDGIESMVAEVKKFVEDNLNSDDEYIITTRFDNDDLLHEDFIAEIQNLFVPRQNAIIDLKYGYQLIIKEGQYKLKRFYQSLNPFISLIESSRNYKTVINRNHNEYISYENVKTTKKEPLWIQFIHGDNKLNKEFSYLYSICKVDLSKFGIEKNSINLEVENIAFKNLRTFPLRMYYKIKIYIKNKLNNQ